MDDDSTRDRVRALVREVLAKAAPEDVPASTPTRFVNTVSETSTQPAVTRDESAKSVITEDDVRGLETGAVLRIGEDARLTPLAADIISEKKMDLEVLIPMELMRDHTKTNDIIQITDEQMRYYREVSLEQAEIYTGRFVHRLVTIQEEVQNGSGRKGFRESYRVKLSYTPLGGRLMLSGPGGQRVQARTKRDDRIVELQAMTTEISWNDCCNPCGGGAKTNRDFKAVYESGYRTPEEVPSTIVYGCLKFITWAMANPGDELLTVRNRLGTTETGLIGTNNGAWASGAIEHWQGYRVRR